MPLGDQSWREYAEGGKLKKNPLWTSQISLDSL